MLAVCLCVWINVARVRCVHRSLYARLCVRLCGAYKRAAAHRQSFAARQAYQFALESAANKTSFFYVVVIFERAKKQAEMPRWEFVRRRYALNIMYIPFFRFFGHSHFTLIHASFLFFLLYFILRLFFLVNFGSVPDVYLVYYVILDAGANARSLVRLYVRFFFFGSWNSLASLRFSKTVCCVWYGSTFRCRDSILFLLFLYSAPLLLFLYLTVPYFEDSADTVLLFCCFVLFYWFSVVFFGSKHTILRRIAHCCYA